MDYHERTIKWKQRKLEEKTRKLKEQKHERDLRYHKTQKYKILRIRRHLQKKYNLTVGEILAMFLKQKGRCAICQREIIIDGEKTRNSGNIDHDHQTGRVRGLLCNDCNLGLGFFKDKINNLAEAILYLKNAENDS